MRKTWNRASQLFWKIRDIHHIHRNMAQDILNANELHFGQPRILHVIKENEGATQKELAELLHTTPASFATSIKRMEKIGFLEKTVDQKDMRKNSVRLTAKGEQAMEKTLHQLTQMDEQMFAGFTDEECEQLQQLLTRICDNLPQSHAACSHTHGEKNRKTSNS